MGKGHLAKMLFIESIITTTVSIIGGILAGILFEQTCVSCVIENPPFG